MQNRLLILIGLLVWFGADVFAQKEYTEPSFNDRRVINSHSVEMLKSSKMDFRIGHRFGDLLGSQGGWNTFYGLENAADISIGLDYGVTDNINIGLSRTKGIGELRQLVNTFFKARLMRQLKKNTNPISITVLGMANVSTMKKSSTEGILSSFPKWSNRLAYHLQLMFARRFNTALSLQVNLNYTYRDIVYSYDQNDIVSIGLSGRARLTKVTSLIFDLTYPLLDSNRELPETYYAPLGVGIEFETGGGHIFQFNLTNTKGISETDYIPYSYSNWADGGFRLGFTISRKFNVR